MSNILGRRPEAGAVYVTGMQYGVKEAKGATGALGPTTKALRPPCPRALFRLFLALRPVRALGISRTGPSVYGRPIAHCTRAKPADTR